MDIKSADKHFLKLTKFYENVRSDGTINSIEKDLLKSYVLNFYEALSSNGSQVATEPRQISTSMTPPPVKSAKPVDVPRTIEPVNKVSSNGNGHAVAAQTVAPVVQQVTTPKTTTVSQLDPKVNKLLDIAIGKELSDTLSTTPIEDISTSMSINDRVSTMVELFAGNKDAFAKTMKKLNKLDNFEEAKSYLAANVVEKYDWHDAEKTEKVKTLMKLVYRRYV